MQMQDNQTSLSSLRLWQLISPALPVGAYAYSQGLEYALHAGWICDGDEVQNWIQGQVENTLCSLDVPVLSRLYTAWSENDTERINYWSRFLLASRESDELVKEDIQLGRALATLLSDLDITEADAFRFSEQSAFLNLLALAGVKWRVPINQLAQGYLWSWCENQVAAAIKLIPLGQTKGQKILLAVSESIPTAAASGLLLLDDDIGAMAPGLGIASALHETQYSRLFRS